MKFKKMLSLFTAAAISVSAFAGMAMSASAAATVDDLVAIEPGNTYWFDTHMVKFNESNEPVATGLSKGELILDKHFFSPTGNSAAANKNFHEVTDGIKHYNCLRLKSTQNMLQFKVSGAAQITIYTNSDSGRGVVVTSTLPSSAYTYDTATAAIGKGVIAVESVNTKEFSFNVNGATSLCLSSYSGDFHIAGVKVAEIPSEKVDVAGVNLNITSKTLTAGSTVKLSATVSPSNATNKNVTWSSDNTAVAKVDNGTVTAVAGGTANITATTEDGGLTASAKITVIGASDPAAIPPSVEVIKAYKGNHDDFTNGNQCTNNDVFVFTDSANPTYKAIFADPVYGSIVNTNYIPDYLNYIGGTYNTKTVTGETKYHHPTLTFSCDEPGDYAIYYLGSSRKNYKVKASINDGGYIEAKTTGDKIAAGDSKSLYVSEINFTTNTALTDAEIVFDIDDEYLPDVYAVVIARKPAYNGDVTFRKAYAAKSESDTAVSTFTLTFNIGGTNSYNTINVTAPGQTAKWTGGTVTGDSSIVYGIILEGEFESAEGVSAVASYQ